ncbi:MAG: 50S ribosomal protein L21 [Candidatus Paceibacterota bacterium]|jgi:large subunit ribosomal protein L21
MSFAIIKTGGKQYKVTAGTKLKIEKLEGVKDDKIVFDKVLLTENKGEVVIGTPFVKAASVEGKILAQVRDEKKITFKYSSKARTRRKKGHKQHLTEVEIVSI